MSKMVKCPFCEKMADTSKDNCPHCGGPLGFEYKPDAAQTQTVVKEYEAVGGMKPPVSSASDTGRKCPSCGAQTKASDIICIQCGTNLLVKNQANVEMQRGAPSGGGNAKLYLSAAAVLVLTGLAGAAGYVLLANPVDKAKALAKSGNALEAVNVIGKHIETHPDDVAAQNLLGKLLWKTQQYEQAAAAFEKVMQLDPSNKEAGLMAVSALAKNTITPQTQQQVAILEKVTQTDTGNADAWYLLALAQGALGNYGAQADALEKAMAGGKSDSAQVVFRSIAQALSGNARPALNNLDNAEASPEKDAVEGLLAYMAGQRDRALAALEKAQANESSMQGIVATRLGLLYLSDGQLEAAHELFLKAAQMPNAPPAAAFFDAVCLQARGFDTEAVKAFETVMDAQKEFAQEAAMQLSLLYLRQNNPDMANNMLKHARQMGEESAKLLTLEGQVLLKSNALDEAQARFQAAMKLDPSYPAAHLEYGLMYIAGGGLREGLLELERFLTLAKSENSPPQVNEIELLVNQLKTSATAAPAVASAPVSGQ